MNLPQKIKMIDQVMLFIGLEKNFQNGSLHNVNKAKVIGHMFRHREYAKFSPCFNFESKPSLNWKFKYLP